MLRMSKLLSRVSNCFEKACNYPAVAARRGKKARLKMNCNIKGMIIISRRLRMNNLTQALMTVRLDWEWMDSN